MSNQSCLKYFVAIGIAFCFQPVTSAQTKPNQATDIPVNFQNRLSSPWESAVLTRTRESTREINTIEFSPDGEILASIGANQITLWQVERGEIQHILPGHYATELGMEIAPTAIAFSSDSRFLATATWSQGLLAPDGSIQVWDLATKEIVLSLKESDGCRQVLFDVAGEILYGACGFGVSGWSFPEGKKLFSFDTEYPLEAIAIHPQGKIMATVDANTTGGEGGEQSNRIQLWQLERDESVLLNTLDGHANDIARIEFTPDGQKLVSSSYDGKINVWNWQEGTLEGKTNNLYSNNGLFSLSADSRLIAGNFYSSAMTDLITGLPLRNIMTKSSREKTKLMAFSPQGNLLVRVKPSPESDRSLIQFWQIDGSQAKKTPTARNNYRPLPLAEYWQNRKSRDSDTMKVNTDKPAAIGKDPQAIALSALGLRETTESESEQIELDYPQENLAVVTITQTNLADDSVAAIRYRVEFAPYGGQDQKQWQVIWAGQQFQCRRDRSHQDWGKNLCL